MVFFRKTKIDVKLESKLLPFSGSNCCPKCCSFDIEDANYCKGKKFLVNSCEHKVKGEHLHRECFSCGYRWAHEVYNGVTKVDCPKGLKVLSKVSEVKTVHNPLKDLGFGEEFLNEVKSLQEGTSKLPPSPIEPAKGYDPKKLDYYMGTSDPISSKIPSIDTEDNQDYYSSKAESLKDSPFKKTAVCFEFDHEHTPKASSCAREAMLNELSELARRLNQRDYENSVNSITTLTGLVNLL